MKKKTNQLLLIKKDFKKNYVLIVMAIPMIVFYILFHYAPMYGVVIAFKDFVPTKGILGSQWIGFENFTRFFSSYYFGRLIRNTLLISILSILWGFPAPIILALLLNEIKSKAYKRTVQSITYVPHFISLVVVCGIIVDFTSTNGLINEIRTFFGLKAENLLAKPELFRTIFISTNIWKSIGWGSIIYLAAISGIDQQMYEAATIDGAGRFRKIWYITIPSIIPTIVILFILRLGQVMTVGFEKIILLYNPRTYETADVISSYVYRKGIEESDFSYSAAIGLFNSVINFMLLLISNKLSNRLSSISLW